MRRIESIREDNPVTALSSANQLNPSSSMTAKLDAHDIANRIMREENYLIALFNKDLLDLRVPLPAFLANIFNGGRSSGLTLSTALEHNLRICLMRYLFDTRGRVKEVFLKERNRADLLRVVERTLGNRGGAPRAAERFVVEGAAVTCMHECARVGWDEAGMTHMRNSMKEVRWH